MNGLLIGGLALLGGGAWWAMRHHDAATPGDCSKCPDCVAFNRQDAIKCFEAATCKACVSSAAQVAIDLMYTQSGGASATTPNENLTADEAAAYGEVLQIGGTPAPTYEKAVHDLDVLWTAGSLYEASIVAAAIATMWGQA